MWKYIEKRQLAFEECFKTDALRMKLLFKYKLIKTTHVQFLKVVQTVCYHILKFDSFSINN